MTHPPPKRRNHQGATNSPCSGRNDNESMGGHVRLRWKVVREQQDEEEKVQSKRHDMVIIYEMKKEKQTLLVLWKKKQ